MENNQLDSCVNLDLLLEKCRRKDKKIISPKREIEAFKIAISEHTEKYEYLEQELESAKRMIAILSRATNTKNSEDVRNVQERIKRIKVLIDSNAQTTSSI
mmetsp:Transcript_41297/g.47608  ORF Transcript_41297/g.47608 Transcript_41297/m.47608 type:complete len:101 (+) Transcript_41297:25-327(+)